MPSNIVTSFKSSQPAVCLYLLLLLHLILSCSSFQPGHFSYSRRCDLGTARRSPLSLGNVGVDVPMDSDRDCALSSVDTESDEEDALEYSDEVGQSDKMEDTSGLPKCYVIISNLQSGSNIGSICRNALAFNVHEVIVVGRKGFRDKMRNADRGAKRRQTFVHFNSVSEAAVYLKEERNCSIVGVEIMDSAVRKVLSSSQSMLFVLLQLTTFRTLLTFNYFIEMFM